MPNKELTTETRLLLAFVLVGIVLVGWNYIYKPPPPPVTPPVTVPAPVHADPPVEAPKPIPAAPAQAVEVPGQVQASQAEEFTIETDLYRVQFSNQGAVVRSWILKKYKDGKGKPLELVNTMALSKVPAPFAVAFRNQAPPNDPNKGLFKVERDGDLGRDVRILRRAHGDQENLPVHAQELPGADHLPGGRQRRAAAA